MKILNAPEIQSSSRYNGQMVYKLLHGLCLVINFVLKGTFQEVKSLWCVPGFGNGHVPWVTRALWIVTKHILLTTCTVATILKLWVLFHKL